MGRLFWKFFSFILLAQITSAVGVGIIASLERYKFIQNGVDLDLSAPAGFFVKAAAATLQAGHGDALRNMIEGGNRRRIYAVDETLHELLGREVPPLLLENAMVQFQNVPDQQAVEQVSSTDGHTYLLFMSAPTSDNGLLWGNGTGAQSRFFSPFMLMGTTASLIFAMLLAWYFSHPIRQLKSAFASAAAGNLSKRLAPQMSKRNDELADLGRDFDIMTDQLRTLMDSQRRLLHDVSHELRSPIARMQAAIGLARLRPENMLVTINRLEREGVRMNTLVGELLSLSRLEAGVTGPMEDEIRMEDLLHEIIHDAHFEAAANQRHIKGRIDSDVLIKGCAELLHSAIENVVRNAIKQTAIGTTVTISAQIKSHLQQLLIEVCDQGPGVPDDELLLIFAPFFRSSRTQKTSNGYGLGLTIARRIIEAHHGSISASNTPGQGLCMSIILPYDALATSRAHNEHAKNIIQTRSAALPH